MSTPLSDTLREQFGGAGRRVLSQAAPTEVRNANELCCRHTRRSPFWTNLVDGRRDSIVTAQVDEHLRAGSRGFYHLFGAFVTAAAATVDVGSNQRRGPWALE